MDVRKVGCTTALSFSSLPGLTYSLNPYKGCQHACAYCYVPNVLRIPREDWGKFIDARMNIPMVLEKELKRKKPGVVGVSTVTDPYQPIEKQYQLTRQCLGQLLLHDFPVCVQTKSSLVVRDLDLLSRFSTAEIMISIATLNDAERKILEPFASPVEERLKVLRKSADAGIKTSVFFGPVYPSITPNDIPHILDTFLTSGVSEILIDRLNIKPGILENIMNRTKGFELHDYFSKPLQEYYASYQRVRDKLLQLGKEQKVKIVDAF